jgi:hypothetical protein
LNGFASLGRLRERRPGDAGVTGGGQVEAQRTVTLWSSAGRTVWARRGEDNRELVIFGQDLCVPPFFGESLREYEYGLSVAEADIPTVLTALQAAPDADVLDVLERAGSELVRAGESKWLRALGIEFEFWSRME